MTRLLPVFVPLFACVQEDLTGGAGPRLGDFRPYVFGAYTAVFVLLALYCLRLAARHRALVRDLDALRRRTEPDPNVRNSG